MLLRQRAPEMQEDIVHGLITGNMMAQITCFNHITTVTTVLLF